MFYSSSTGGFYDQAIHGGAIPADAKAISKVLYDALMQSQGLGKVIRPDANGMPVAVDPDPAPVVVPTSVTMRQARLALLAAGKLGAVSAAVADADEAMRIDWEFAATVDRNSPTVTLLAAALNLDSAKLDQLFTAAAAL